MERRDFVKAGTLLTLGGLAAGLVACNNEGKEPAETPKTTVFTLPELPYAPEALEPYIDARTMGIHHGKHHAGYVRKLNAALEGHTLAGKSLEDIVKSVTGDDINTGVRNNGGGHFNHSLFWKVMRPGEATMPDGVLGDAINSTFESFDKFKEAFANAGATRFGSGWAWLSVDKGGKLFVSSTANQDNPLMGNIVEQAGTPILGIDVWEHAYYLKYQNLRKDYINNFFNLINWEAVAANYAAVK